MKKIFSAAIIMVVLVATILCSTFAVSATSFKLGDVNKDGKVDVLDVTEIQQYIVELKTLDSDAQKAADVNGDGRINVNDATIILKYLANIIDVLPAEPVTTKPTSPLSTDSDGYLNVIIKP